MHFEGEFRHVGSVDPIPLRRAVEAMGDEAWLEYVRRQERFEAHRKTQTVPLIYDEDMRHEEPTVWPRFESLEPTIRPFMDLIREANSDRATSGGDPYFIRAILTKLAPMSVILPHRDKGYSLFRSHRYHIALKTNEKVDFGINQKIQHFAAGEIWEINNRAFHAVRNLSDEPRIHLILDYVIPGEHIDDPELGPLTA